jgi:hypothetical protein
MRVFLALALAALAVCARAEPREDAAPEEDASPSGDEESDMSLDLGRANFESIVQAFVARRSAPAGYWALRDKKTGQVRHLTLVSVDAKAVRGAGRSRFNGPALLRDEVNREALSAEFLVDMSGTEWKVAGMRLLGPAKKARAPRH